MNRLLKQVSSLMFASVFLASCGGGSSGNSVVTPQSGDSGFDGSLPSVTDIYNQNQIDALSDIGLVLNLGDMPPNIEGTYRFDNSILQASTVPGDVAPGTFFANSTITFSNQDNNALTVEFLSIDDGGTNTGTSVGSGSFISGSDQLFTVYVVTQTTIGGSVADTTITISGRVTQAGIENIQSAGFMLDNRGDDFTFIPNNTGRLLIDTDGLAERLISTAALRDSKVHSATGSLFSR